MAQLDQLDSPAQVAERLQIPERTLNDWRYKGVGPRYLRIGKHVRYRRADVEDWLRRQSVACSRPA
jgi:excisionase family DNA binding protein